MLTLPSLAVLCLPGERTNVLSKTPIGRSLPAVTLKEKLSFSMTYMYIARESETGTKFLLFEEQILTGASFGVNHIWGLLSGTTGDNFQIGQVM